MQVTFALSLNPHLSALATPTLSSGADFMHP